MKIPSLNNVQAILLLGAAGAITYFAYRAAKAGGSVAESVVASVNPVDSRNIVNRGVSAVGQVATGDADWTLGGQLAEWFSPQVRAANEMLRNSPSYTPPNAPYPEPRAIREGARDTYPEPRAVREAALGMDAPIGVYSGLTDETPTALVNIADYPMP